MRKIGLIIASLLYYLTVNKQNPIFSAGVYIADTTAWMEFCLDYCKLNRKLN